MGAPRGDVLAVFMSADAALSLKNSLEGILGTRHMGWSLVVNRAGTFAEAVEKTPDRPNLQIVLVSDCSTMIHAAVVVGCEDLARVLQNHPCQPWIMFTEEDGARRYTDIFTQSGLHVEHSLSLWDAIEAHWLAAQESLAQHTSA